MPEPDTSAYLTVATALQQIIATEFADEGFTAIRDNQHESLGRTRVDIGIAPAEDYPAEDIEVTQETYLEIRFYDLWTQEITPETVVDPARIAGFAERLKKAIFASTATDPGTDEVWYFSVKRTTYANDPTGNKTRFHMVIKAFGNNAGLVETSG
jgi:hypothetical protein